MPWWKKREPEKPAEPEKEPIIVKVEVDSALEKELKRYASLPFDNLTWRGDEFYPLESLVAPQIISTTYQNSLREASMIASMKRIIMAITPLRAVHLRYEDEELKVGIETLTLKSNCAIYPYGIRNNDRTLNLIRWWKGRQIQYIGDWAVKSVAYYANKTGIYGGRLDNYVSRGNETLTIECLSRKPKGSVDAWLKAFVVLPESMMESRIVY